MKLLPDTRHFLRPSALTYFQKKSLLDMIKILVLKATKIFHHRKCAPQNMKNLKKNRCLLIFKI